jgi:hypothetical protein
MVRLQVQLEEELLEINNWVDFFLYALFTLGAITIGLPMGVLYTFAGIKYFRIYGLKKFPKNIDANKYGKSSIEALFVGFFMIGSSVLYLFIDKGGHLYKCIEEAQKFLFAI